MFKLKKLIEELRLSGTLKSYSQVREEVIKIMESPMKIPKWVNNKMDEHGYNYATFEYIKKHGKYLGKYKNYEIYELEKDGKLTDIFVGGDLIQVMFIFIVNNDVMMEKVVWQSILQPGECRDILFNYYLERYAGVISDEMHTPNGEKYWKKLLEQSIKRGYKIYSINVETNEGQSLKLDDIDKFYGYTTESQDYRFLIKSK